MLEFLKPIPVIIKESGAEAYALYVESGGMLENDIWTVVLCDGGTILHCMTDQLKIHVNKTFGIEKEVRAKGTKSIKCICPENNGSTKMLGHTCKLCGGLIQ